MPQTTISRSKRMYACYIAWELFKEAKQEAKNTGRKVCICNQDSLLSLFKCSSSEAEAVIRQAVKDHDDPNDIRLYYFEEKCKILKKQGQQKRARAEQVTTQSAAQEKQPQEHNQSPKVNVTPEVIEKFAELMNLMLNK